MAARALLAMGSGPALYKQKAISEARTQQRMIEDKLRRLGIDPRPYTFTELIGKGAYGRVYKSVEKDTGKVVAIKVLEADAIDFEARGPTTDSGMEDALKEIRVLRRLKESRAVNVNRFHDAFQVHSQLWIVSEYCSGGSLTTLRRATSNKISERHIVPIARELALGLRSVHEAGIIHRDVKCSNVMINERGDLQIIDFGVAGILLSHMEADKRKTVIGTPHWMAPEMQLNQAEIAHGTEVDVWAFGITIFECAMGAPPNARTMPGRELQASIRRKPAPRLDEDRFSAELRDLIAFALEPDPSKRPSMAEICKHPFVQGTEISHPTATLRDLIESYYLWERAGGQRSSLFMAGGAVQPHLSDASGDSDEEWNFSTTANFERMHSSSSEDDFRTMGDVDGDMSFLSASPPDGDEESTEYGRLAASRSQTPSRHTSVSRSRRPSTDTRSEARAARGARHMQGIFDANASPYKFGAAGSSDLPLRTGDSSTSLHRKEVSVTGNSTGAPQINLDIIPAKKAARPTTMAWKWDDNLAPLTSTPAVPPNASTTASALVAEPAHHANPPAQQARPPLRHAVTMPVAPAERPQSERLDLDMLMGSEVMALSAASSAASNHHAPAPSSDFLLDPPDDDGEVANYTVRASVRPPSPSAVSIASQISQQDPALAGPQIFDEHNLTSRPVGVQNTAISEENSMSDVTPSNIFASALNGNASNGPLDSVSAGMVPPIPVMALTNDAPPAVLEEALRNALVNWTAMLGRARSTLDSLDAQSLPTLGLHDDDNQSSRVHSRTPSSSGPPPHSSSSSLSSSGFGEPGSDVGAAASGWSPTGFAVGLDGSDADGEGEGETGESDNGGTGDHDNGS